jgi:hypothetical protein
MNTIVKRSSLILTFLVSASATALAQADTVDSDAYGADYRVFALNSHEPWYQHLTVARVSCGIQHASLAASGGQPAPATPINGAAARRLVAYARDNPPEHMDAYDVAGR